jgi:hypothetical protein
MPSIRSALSPVTLICFMFPAVFCATAAGALAQPCPPDSLDLVPAIDVTTWPDAPFRWKDIAGNLFATAYQDTYLYDHASVVIAFDSCQDSVFAGSLSGINLKPNFAYQVKLVGKPEGVWGLDGDDATNERIGYAGRWWRSTPDPGNSTDQDYEAHKDDPDYVYEGYLLFDFFLTDSLGSADAGFATRSSYHVLWWEHQRARGSCDSPIRWSSVVGHAADPAYDENVGPLDVGVYAEIERLCEGETKLGAGSYNCRFVLTEESFHQSGEGDGYWASVLKCDTLAFELGGPAGVEPGTDPGVEPGMDPGAEPVSDRGPAEFTAVCPNPVRDVTLIGFHLEEETPVELGIYDVEGRLLKTLLSEMPSSGDHFVAWDGRDSSGRHLGPGLYLLKLETASSARIRKVILLH